MKLKKSIFYIITVTVLLALTFGTAMADDSVIFRRNISKTPAGETEYASISFMRFTVPAQAADGTLVDLTLTYEFGTNEAPVPIYQDTGTVINTAKPLVASYIDEEQVEETLLSGNEIMGGLVIGEFDGFVAHSLDDGATWKTTNVSESAEKSSFNLQNGTAYPGAVYGMVQSTIGNRVMAAWLSRYCDEGSPLYTLVGDSTDAEDVAYKVFLQDDDTYNLSDLYVTDIWAVAGAQKSVDFTLQGFPEVGEIPYGCVWTARGTLIATGIATDSTSATVETHDIVWSKPERLTSGVRDPNRLEIDGVDGAGFAITWQEDPEGLRPGLGLGPGEGWSGAIVNAKTDIWYSYIDWDHFNLVDEDGDYATIAEPLTIETYFDQNGDGVIDEDLESNKPKVAIPMAMPARLTDNNMCKASTSSDPTKVSPAYCYVDFDIVDADSEVDLPDMLPTGPILGSSDLCTESMAWATPGGSTINICKTEDGRYLNGRVGASRARMTLQPYTKADGTPGAWFIMAYEELKALGEYTIIPGDDTSDPIEIGKNIWYHTFDMLEPVFASQGGMLNQPTRFNPEFAFDETLGASEDLIGAWDGDFLTLTDEWGYTLYQSEIARRFSMIAQPVAKIGETRTSAYLLYKQGILNQGGPADIFARRIVVPPADDPATTDIVEGTFNSATDNPYAYENMVCEDDPNTTLLKEGWIIEPGLDMDDPNYNPNYIQGLCGANATNLSGNTIEALDFSTTECYDPADPTACAAIFPWGGNISDFPKVETWSQSGYDQNGVASDPYAEQVEGSGRTFNSNLDDQSWEDPFDVAKGHRGFLDGDFLYIMYAWSPNWKANSVGNDKYNLYGRRSFDGGATWTTTPTDLGGAGLVSTDTETDDPSLCENYGIGGQAEDITKECFSYIAGGFEQARNVSQLTGTKVTILDPRYTPSGGPKKFTLQTSYTSGTQVFDYDIPAFDYLDDGTLARDPSKLFVVFETGDNTTAAEGEPTPLDLYYSRGTVYGDYYEWVTEDWLPVEDMAFTTTDEYRWNWLEKDQEDLSGEAALTANPSGDFLYSDWSQWREDEHENVFDSDIWFSRMFYNDEVETLAVVTIENATLLPSLFDTDLELILTASAVDYDRFGDGLEIVEYEWSIDGVVASGQADSHFNAPPRTLSTGWHNFSVRAKDNDGQWSRPVSVRLLIVEEIHTVFLPLMKR